MNVARGWQFFMHPGPTNIPNRVLQAMHRPTVDFTAPEFVALRDRSLERMKAILKTKRQLIERQSEAVDVAKQRLAAVRAEREGLADQVRTLKTQQQWIESMAARTSATGWRMPVAVSFWIISTALMACFVSAAR